MSTPILNARQRAVMRFMFDTDAPAEAVTARGIEECQALGLIKVGGCGEMTTTNKGEAMKDEFTPKKIDWAARNKEQRQKKRERRERKAAKKGETPQ